MSIGLTWDLGIAAVLAVTSTSFAQHEARPNIVLIMADDMGYSDLGCYGGEIKTPHLDALAADGIRFTQFYNAARCCPTRASLLTGLYPHQAGVGAMVSDQGRPGYRGRLNGRCVTIAEALRPAGYQCFIAGKWHVSPFSYEKNEGTDRSTWPLQREFDRFYGMLAGAGSFYHTSGMMRDNTPFLPPAEGFYFTDAITDAAEGFVRDAEDQPFFLYLAYTAPHWPLHAFEEDIARYDGVYDEGWDAIRAERHARMIEMGIVREAWPLTPRDERVKAWEETEHRAWQARRMQVYAAQVERMDRNIGLFLETLKREGRYENTLILFLSDNGGCAEVIGGAGKGRSVYISGFLPEGVELRGGNSPEIMPGGPDTFASYGIGWANVSNTPFRLYKKFTHEGGVSTPLITHWPAGIPAGRRGVLTDAVGHVIDIMATCVEAAGIEYPEQRDGVDNLPMEGVSLLSVLRGERLVSRPVFFEHLGHRAVRLDDFKLVARGRKGAWELYNLRADRTEMNDLAGEQPERVSRMAALWEEWAKRTHVN